MSDPWIALRATTRARIGLGRTGEASMELQRILPRALASSGPRWVGAIADLSAVAAGTHNTDAAERLYQALAPFQGRLVIFGGANSVTGPVDHYLGLLATAEIEDQGRCRPVDGLNRRQHDRGQVRGWLQLAGAVSLQGPDCDPGRH